MAATGVWTWRVRGAKVPAVQKNDVRLEIDPAADSHYCPDCLIGSIRPAARRRRHQVVKCRDCGSMLVFVHDRHAARAATN